MRRALLAGAATLLLGLPLARPARAEMRLERTVLLMRHAVRSQLATPSLNRITRRPWPAWEVGAGAVTPHGAQLITLLGVYVRERLARQAVLPAPGACPEAGTIAIWSDVDRRTRATAEAFAAGVAPGCGLVPQHLAHGRDPIFTPQQADICPIDLDTARREILARVGGSFEVPIAARIEQYLSMQALLSDGQCGTGPDCLLSLPPSIGLNRHKRVAISGPVGVAATAAETFLMQFADGWPLDQVGWGQVGPQQIGELLALKHVAFDLDYRTPYLARLEGSILLEAIVRALEGESDGDPRSEALAHARLAVLVGHDGNLAVISTLLGLTWNLPGLPDGDTPPGGFIAFSLYRDTDTGARQVRLTYVTQSVEQIRDATPLSLAHPPLYRRIVVPGCDDAAKGCTLEVFRALANAAEDHACLMPPLPAEPGKEASAAAD